MWQQIRLYWPLAAVIGAGLITWGYTTSRVEALEVDQAEIKKIQDTDHDVLIEIRTRQEFLVDKVDTVGEDVKEILRRGTRNGSG